MKIWSKVRAFFFGCKNKEAKEIVNQEAAQMPLSRGTLSREIDGFKRELAKKREQPGTEKEIRCMILTEYKRLNAKYLVKVMLDANAYIRFCKDSFRLKKPLIEELLEFVDEKNYKRLTERLYDLRMKIIQKEKDPMVRRNCDIFCSAFGQHLLRLPPHDSPIIFLLGEICESNNQFSEARAWYRQLSDTPFSIKKATAICSSYSREKKSLLKNGDKPFVKKKTALLDKEEAHTFCQFINVVKGLIEEEDTETAKRYFVKLTCAYARALKTQGHPAAALHQLDGIPADYPDPYRVLVERGMVFQAVKSRQHHDLNKAIACFLQAREFLEKSGGDPLAKKTVLVPLSASYYANNQPEEALRIARDVLEIDPQEKRAKTLVAMIEKTAHIKNECA